MWWSAKTKKQTYRNSLKCFRNHKTSASLVSLTISNRSSVRWLRNSSYSMKTFKFLSLGSPGKLKFASGRDSTLPGIWKEYKNTLRQCHIVIDQIRWGQDNETLIYINFTQVIFISIQIQVLNLINYNSFFLATWSWSFERSFWYIV